jgi:hypothetical protein
MKIWLNRGKNDKINWGWQWDEYPNTYPLSLGPGSRGRIADMNGDGVSESSL